MEISVRPACLEDAAMLPAIEACAGNLFRTVPGLEWIADDEVLTEDAHRRLIALGTVWVAQAGPGPLRGFVSAEAFGDELHTWELAVDAGHQQMGIGRRLMQKACGHACAHGLSSVTLTTFRDLAWNAPWYARLGFRQEQPLRGSRLEAVLDAEARHGLPVERRVAMRLPAAQAGW